ncbi:hypothetical protein ACG83_10660 [Frankia sp. R43]|nr:hypothetical protein ACG83_10660 [Frankia sp. R43]
MIWVLDHLADIESDLSAIHRIEDMYALSGPRFFRLAWRLAAYRGVMRMRAEELALEHQRHSSSPCDPRVAGRSDSSAGAPERVGDEELRHSSRFAGLIEWGRG